MKATPWLLGLLLLAGCGQLQKDSFRTTPHVNYQKAARLNVGLAHHYLEQGHMSRAHQKLLRAQKLAPHMPEVLTGLGRYHEQLADNAEAGRLYQEALRYAPHAGVALQAMAGFLCRNGYDNDAEAHYQEALKDPEYPHVEEVLLDAGMCALHNGHKDRAKAHLQKAARYNTSNPEVWLQLAQMAFEEGAYEQAHAYWQAYDNTQHTLTPEALALSLALHERLGQYEQARMALQHLVTLFPQSPTTQRIQASRAPQP